MIIDVHTHYMTNEHWGDEWRKNWQGSYGKPFPLVTPQIYDEAMSGIDVAIVFGMKATDVGVHTPNSEVADFCASTQTKTIGFMALDPTDGDVLAQMIEGVNLGLRGIKLYPVLAHFDAREPKYEPFFELALKNQLVLMWHVGTTPSPTGDLSVTQPLIIDHVARRFPDLIQIMAHMGHPWQRETITVLRKNRKVFSDISASWSRPFDGFQAIVRAQEWKVTHKLLFGSDFPLWTPAEAIAGFRSLAELRAGNLPHVEEETIEQILYQDSLTLLGLNA
jgi:predicted TIM-barrel fold metal-dependent hydrolase